MKVLGIDPGSRLVGYGIITKQGSEFITHTHGTLKLDTKQNLLDRLPEIYSFIKNLITEHKPDHVSIEKIFFAQDVQAALKLGHARGVALLAVKEIRLPVFEYSPNEVKLATVGHGHADKEQVAKMLGLLLGVKNFETQDASDALAIALCHLQSYSLKAKLLGKENVRIY